MANASWEILQVCSLFHGLVFSYKRPCKCSLIMKPLFFMNNPFIHECIKQIEIDYRVVHNRVLASTPHVGTSSKLDDILA